MEDLKALLDRIPDADHFPTVEEIEQRLQRLEASADGVGSLHLIGRSRRGQPLTMLTVGEGARHAVVTGMPHPNEPLGALGALALADLLISDEALRRELGLVWHIIPCVDPDGAALNYGWFRGPFTRHSYAEHVYRPPFDEQYEWTFSRPALDTPGLPWMPESSAVAAVIDRIKPELLISMHNAEAGALYTYVSSDRPGIDGAVQTVCDAVGLDVYAGIPEDNEPVLGPGLFLMGGTLGDMLSSTGYAEPYGTLGVVVEPPMWREPRCADPTPSQRSRRDVDDECRQLSADLQLHMNDWMEVIRAHAAVDDVRGRALTAQLGSFTPDDADTETDPGVVCTVAEEASSLELAQLERLRNVGHLLGFLKDREVVGPLHPELAVVRDAATQALAAWADAQDDQEFVGLGAGVRAHVGMALEMARLVNRTESERPAVAAVS